MRILYSTHIQPGCYPSRLMTLPPLAWCQTFTEECLMKYLCLPLLLTAGVSEASVQLFHQSVGSTDITALKSMLNDEWTAPPATDASQGFVHQQYGIRWQADNHWQLQWSKRLSGSAVTDSATAVAYYQLASELPLTPNQDIPAQLNFRSIEATGLSLAYQGQYSDWHYQLRLTHWSAQRYRESYVDGTVRGNKDGAINGLLNFTEYYSHSNFLKRPHQRGDWQQDGQGYSADLSLRGQLSSNWGLQLDLQDLYSALKFDQLGFTQGQINSQNSFINAAGYLEFIPVLQGRELAQARAVNLPKQLTATSSWQLNQSQQLLLQLQRLHHSNRWQLGFAQQWRQGQWQFWLDPVQRLPGLRYQYQDWLLELAADKTSLDQITEFRLNLQIPLWF